MEIRRSSLDHPFFSICIPQYNRTSFLIESCRGLAAQSFKNFEVCISDDCSTDGREEELLSFLRESNLSFVYRKQEKNIRYDANLRASISLSKGAYCFLLGNDDVLASPATLLEIYEEMQRFGPAGAVITNYREYESGRVYRRIHDTESRGAGPVVAANNYRNVSFVSGVVLDGARARSLATAKWDGSEMYQMYLMCRIVSEGKLLLGINEIAVLKDLQIKGEKSDGTSRERLNPCPITERKHTFHYLGRLVVDAIDPFVDPRDKQNVYEKILQQLLTFTYPFWIFEFRRTQSWNYAAGICLGMRPRNFTEGIQFSRLAKIRIKLLYLLVSIVGLSAPVGLFTRLRPRLHSFAKSKFGESLVGARSARVC